MFPSIVAENTDFGRYRTVRLLGRGGMAEVFLAEQIGPQDFVKPCVLKRITPEFIANSTIRKMFLAEAKLSALLNHPNIVQTFDFGEVDGQPYMAMEFVDGVNLAALCSRLSKNRLWFSARTALEIAITICQALKYAHDARGRGGEILSLVHRDVSPQNILVSREGAIKLADFGIAKHGPVDEPTLLPGAKGKPGYMAPEQFLQGAVDARSDLYSLGIVFVELCTGRRVKKKDSGVDHNSVAARIEDMLKADRFPLELEQVVQSLTHLEPAMRPANAGEAQKQLEDLLDKLPDGPGMTQSIRAIFELHFDAKVQEAISNANTLLRPRAHSSSFEFSSESLPAELPQTQDTNANSSKAKEDEKPSPARPISGPQDLLAYWDSPPRAEQVEFDEDQPESDEANSIEVVYSNWQEFFSEEGPVRLESSQLSIERSLELDLTVTPAPIATPKPIIEDLQLDTDQDIAGQVIAKESIDEGHTPPPLAPLAKPKNSLSPFSEAADTKRNLYFIFGGVAILGALALVFWFRSFATAPKTTANRSGEISVTSDPSGAQILLGEKPSGAITPHTLKDLPLDLPIQISVKLAGRVYSLQSTVLSQEHAKQTMHFRADRAQRIFQIRSRPSGATVQIGFRTLKDTTPLSLPALQLGESASLTLSLSGFITKKFVLKSAASTSTVTTIDLEASRQLVIQTSPPGAEIYVDGQFHGQSPTQVLNLPSRSAFTVRTELLGHQSREKKYRLGQHVGRFLKIDLSPTAIVKHKLNKKHQARLKKLESQLRRVRTALKTARADFRSAETTLHKQQRSGTSNVSILAQAFKNAESLRSLVNKLEERLQDALSARDEFHEQLTASP